MQARANDILDAKYEPADIEAILSTMTHLTNDERNQLRSLLYEFEDLLDGTLGDMTSDPVDIELKDGAKPYAGRPYSIPQAHLNLLKKEVERLVQIGVLEQCEPSEWAVPSFAVPKKNNQIRFVTDMRAINARIKRKPFPLPKINSLLQTIGKFDYASALDLNSGYYTIRLTPDASNICTIVMPFGHFRYKRMPMGLATATDHFQHKMSKLMQDLEFVRVYLDDLLIVSNNGFTNHISKLRQVFTKLREANLKINGPKCDFAVKELEYLGFIVSTHGIRPSLKKIEAIKNLKSPTTMKQLKSFLGMVTYYRDTWQHRSHILAPLTELLKKNAGSKKKLLWTNTHEQAFQAAKDAISKDVLLTHPNFSKKFTIHTDASDRQLGSVISQDGKPIAFYSRKLSNTQRNYSVGEREINRRNSQRVQTNFIRSRN